MRVPKILGFALPLTLLACGSGPDGSPAAAAARDSLATSRQEPFHRGNELIVMSRNLYLGADLTPAIAAQTFPDFLLATAAIWTMVQRNDFDVRVQSLADEIARERPDLVGLQEAYVWRTQSPADGPATPAQDVRYDYVGELLAALAARGLEYRAVAEQTLFDFEAPTALGIDVRTTDHSAILARKGVKVRDPRGGVYQTLLPLTIQGQQISVPRGWTSVVAQDHGRKYVFVSTHLEAFHAGVRTAQAGELAALLSGEKLPVVLVGDLNSEPGTEGEAVLAGAGFQDVWAALHPSQAGLTCCWLEDLTIGSPPAPPFSQRIDYVLTRGRVAPLAMEVVGQDPAERLGGLWPSDHGGVVAELRLGHAWPGWWLAGSEDAGGANEASPDP